MTDKKLPPQFAHWITSKGNPYWWPPKYKRFLEADVTLNTSEDGKCRLVFWPSPSPMTNPFVGTLEEAWAAYIAWELTSQNE